MIDFTINKTGMFTFIRAPHKHTNAVAKLKSYDNDELGVEDTT